MAITMPLMRWDQPHIDYSFCEFQKAKNDKTIKKHHPVQIFFNEGIFTKKITLTLPFNFVNFNLTHHTYELTSSYVDVELFKTYLAPLQTNPSEQDKVFSIRETTSESPEQRFLLNFITISGLAIDSITYYPNHHFTALRWAIVSKELDNLRLPNDLILLIKDYSSLQELLDNFTDAYAQQTQLSLCDSTRTIAM